MHNWLRTVAFFLLFFFVSINTYAHDKASDFSMLSGMLHPLSGFDHFLAMFSVGLISSIMGNRNLWLVPMAFVLAMVLGGIIGANAISVPFTETGIAISLIALGLAIMLLKKGMKTLPVFCFVFLFGLYHGNAHGIEIPNAAAPFFYTTGFLITTIFIHVIGLFVGELIVDRKYTAGILKIVGSIILFSGIFFFSKSIF